VNSHQWIDFRTVDCLCRIRTTRTRHSLLGIRSLSHGHRVPNRVADHRQQAPHINMINRQEVARAPLGQATTMHGCRTPRSSHRRPDNPGTFKAPPSLNVGQNLLRYPPHVSKAAVNPSQTGWVRSRAINRADTQNRE
jgi:hypothetical protein